jgi:hypothetical protein
MADGLDLPRIDALPSDASRHAVTPLRARERHPQKRRQPHQPPREDDSEEEPRQVGSRLDVRA